MNKLFTFLLALFFSIGAMATDLVITGIYDGPLPGGHPKGYELYVMNDIPDLSIYSLAVATNGSGGIATGGAIDYTFPTGGATAGQFLYVAFYDPAAPNVHFQTFFGFAPTHPFTSAAGSGILVNGDDALELVLNGVVVDVFGDVNTDGTGQPWEYKDGWAARKAGTAPSTTFDVNDWTYSGPDAFDNQTTNASATVPYPLASYTPPVTVVTTMVTLSASKDNTLYESSTGALSNGAGQYMFSGKTSQGSNSLRRAVISFDISSIPLNATITDVKLKLNASKGGNGTISVNLHTLTSDWGEGTSNAPNNEGSGTTATANDATWVHAFSPSTNWTTVGGDYNTSASATLSVTGLGLKTWTDANMVTDVQNWLTGATNNYGWIIIGDEVTASSSIRFDTKENPTAANQPALEITYTTPPPPDVVITEISYNQPGSDTLEYIELYNNGATTVDMTGWSFTQGVTHTFPATTLNAGAYMVLCIDSLAFQSAFGIAAHEWTSGGLSNSGEDIVLVDAFGTTIDSVDYDDTSPWPTQADGFGPSLELCDINTDNADPASWNIAATATGLTLNSTAVLGTPGAANNCYVPPTNPYPLRHIGDMNVTDANGVADSLNQGCELRGIVYGIDFDGNNGYSFTLIDQTGGINVFSFSDVDSYVVTEGDSIHVKGYIAQFNGLTEILPDSIQLISQGNALAAATVVTALDESTESNFVQLNNLTIVAPLQWSGSGSANIEVTNGVDTFTMRIDSDTDVYGTYAVAPVFTFNLKGLGGQFDNSNPYTSGYQLFPRYATDIMPVLSGTPDVMITELHYNQPSSDTLEYLELYNNGSGAADLTGWTLQGVTYTFPAVTLNPGDYLLLTVDSVALFNAYGILAHEWTSGTLSNGGETIILADSAGNTMDSVTYDDASPWPTLADGFGPSLELCDVNTDNADAANWNIAATSLGLTINGTELFGTPGAANNCFVPPSNPYPLRTIGEMHGEDANGIADSLNKGCELRGVVYGVDLDGNAGLSFYINDATGGINVFNFNDVDAYVVTEGDSIHVKGTIAQFNGLTEIIPDSIQLISQGNALQPDQVVTALDETTEGRLVTIENLSIVDTTEWTGSGSGFNVRFANNTDTFTIRIDADVTDLYAWPAPANALWNITGIGGQFDNSNPYTSGYQLFPRRISDFTLVSSTNKVDLSSEVKFFPNPTSDRLTVQSKVRLEAIRITNMLGQEVNTIYSPQSQVEIPVNHLVNGVYLITFVSSDGIWTKQFVKR